MDKYYKPKLGEKPKPLDINDKDYNVKLFSALNHDNGLIDVELEKEVVISRIAKDLYSSWKSAIRELLNNEYTSCLKAKKLGLNPKIYFTLDPINRILEIEGINSLGISSDIFLNVLRYIGRSANFNGSQIGQFGFGFKSYLMLSENIIVETYSYESKEKYAIMGKKGLGFDILPKPNRDYYGTKLILTVRPEINLYELRNTIINYSKYKDDIDIYVTLTSELKSKWSNNIQKGIHLIEKINLEKMLDKYVKPKYDYIRFNYKDNDLKILFDIHNKDDSNYKILLIKTPIEGRININDGINVIINIKNERLYQPTADRDRLTEKALNDLKVKVDQVISLTIETYINQLDTYDKWLENSKHKVLFKYQNNNIIISNLKSYVQCYSYYEKSKGREYYSTTINVIGKNEQQIFDLLSTKRHREKNNYTISNKYYICNKFSPYYMKELVQKNYSIIVRIDNKDLLGLFLQFGFKLWEKPKDKKRKRPKKISLENKVFTGHFNKTDYRQKYVRNTKDIDIHNNYDKIIVIDNNITNYYDLFKTLRTYYVMIRANKGEIKALRDYPQFIILSDYINDNMDKVYQTTKSPITLKELLEIEGEIKISNFHYYEVANKHKDYIVIGDCDQLFLLCCVLIYKYKNIKIVDFNADSYRRSYSSSGYGNYSYNDNYNEHIIMKLKNMLFVLKHNYTDYYDIMNNMYNHGCSVEAIEKLFKLLRGNKE